jgi:integrase/recombinase XerD
MKFRAERAVGPDTGSTAWVIIDEEFDLHPEANAYLSALRAMDRSINTERIYAGRIALYLTYCSEHRLDWMSPSLENLAAFLKWLVREPLAPRGPRATVPRFRSKSTANAVMTSVCEFLRFGAAHAWISRAVVERLAEPKFLAFAPPGYDIGEEGQFRRIRARSIKYAVGTEPPQSLAPDQLEQLLTTPMRTRDRFLVALLICTGMRIGEALGLRREDMHFLARTQDLGCNTNGPHVHVRRRLNLNGALAKSRFSRTIPVTNEVVGLYAEYQHDRYDKRAMDSDMVFVNLYRPPLGRPMTYRNAKDLFDRLARSLGFEVRPHMLRHTAATGWIRSGVARDVAQALLGHVSPSSMEPYIHPSEAETRDAVDRVAALRREPPS